MISSKLEKYNRTLSCAIEFSVTRLIRSGQTTVESIVTRLYQTLLKIIKLQSIVPYRASLGSIERHNSRLESIDFINHIRSKRYGLYQTLYNTIKN